MKPRPPYWSDRSAGIKSTAGSMNIAFFVNVFPAPSETFILNQVTGLLDRGHRVDIYANARATPSKPDSKVSEYGLMERTTYFDVPASLPIRPLRAIPLLLSSKRKCRLRSAVQSLNFLRYGRVSLSLRLFYSALQLPRQVRYDVIHAQFGSLGPTALCLRDIGAISGKLVTSFRGYDIATLTGRRGGSYRKLFREGDLFLPVSRHFAQMLLDHGCDESKIMVHHSGIDCGAFSFRLRTRLNGEPTKLVTIGRLVEKKGIGYAVRAVARLIGTGRRVRYTVVGDGEMRTELEKLVSGLRLAPHVRLVGWRNQEEIIRFLEDAHLLVAPSVTAANGDLEGIPNSLKEAMARGLPVVSTVHAGIPELVQDGRSGFLVPERDVDALADRLAFLIDHPDRWAQMGRFGRQQVRDHFDTDTLNDRLVEAYHQLARSSHL